MEGMLSRNTSEVIQLPVHVPGGGHVRVLIQNMAGDILLELASGEMPEGDYEFPCQLEQLGHETCLLVMELDGYSIIRRLKRGVP